MTTTSGGVPQWPQAPSSGICIVHMPTDWHCLQHSIARHSMQAFKLSWCESLQMFSLQVLKLFEDFEELDYARAGSQATEDFELAEGPLNGPTGPLPHTVEPILRKYGLPTRLKKVCKSSLQAFFALKLSSHAAIAHACVPGCI